MELSAPSAAASASQRCEGRLSDCGIRPTAQRVRIATLRLSAPQHLSAEQILASLRAAGARVALDTRAPAARRLARICSADRCWGADRRSVAMRTRCAVGRIPQSDSRPSQRWLALAAADGALSSISGHYRHKTAPTCEFCRHGALASGLRELALQVLRELGDGRKVEQLGQVHLPGVLAVDLLVDLDELQRARADLEQVVVDVHALAFERRIADGLELVLDLGARARLRLPLRRAQRRELPQVRVELPVRVALL